jgi:hypothetical protein
LKLKESEIAAMSYETFDEDRQHLLNLQPG